MHAVAPQSPAFHLQLIEFALLMQAPPSTATESILPLLREEFETLLPVSSINLETYNTQYLQQHPDDAEAALAVAKAQWAISEHRDRQSVLDIVTAAFKSGEKPSLAVSVIQIFCSVSSLMNVLSTQTVQAALTFLRDDVQAESGSLQSFITAAKGHFPTASLLKSSDELAAQRASIDEHRRKKKEAGNEPNQ